MNSLTGNLKHEAYTDMITEFWQRKMPLLLVFSLALMLSSCTSNQPKVVTNFNETYQKALTAFNKKKWEKASELFTLVVINSPGSDMADDAQFYLGECHFNRKDYLLAISEYQKLTERYPYSPLVEDALYKIALAQFKNAPDYQLDQEYTLKALDSFQEFIESYPNSKHRQDAENNIVAIRNRLARKLYETGRLYRKLREWEAAIFYLDKMLEKYYDTDYVVSAYLEKAYCLIYLHRFDEYNSILQTLTNKYSKQVTSNQLSYLQSNYNHEQKRLAKENTKKPTW